MDPSITLNCNSLCCKITLKQIDNADLAPFSFRVTRDMYLNTQEFIDAVATELRARLCSKSKL